MSIGANLVDSFFKPKIYRWAKETSLGGAIILDCLVLLTGPNGKFPEFTEPCAGLPRIWCIVKLWGAARHFTLLNLILEGLTDYVEALSPYNAFQIIQP